MSGLVGISFWSTRLSPRQVGAATIALVAVLLAAAVVVSRISPAAAIALGVAILLVVGLAAVEWPRVVLLAVVLSPILDRYLLAGLVPAGVADLSHFLSEGLLASAGAVITIRGWRAGTLVPALRHPTVLLLAGFVASLAVSALLNGVPPVQAAAGIGFTLDAAVIFVLARVVGFTTRQALAMVAALLAVIGAAALVALAQAILRPDILGLRFLTGRFGEVYRLASIFGDPNVFGAFLATAVPFGLFGISSLPTRRGRLMAGIVGFLLLVALWVSFSRGAWLALLIGWVLVSTLLDRRALIIGLVLMLLAFGVALVMPRDLLGSPGLRPDLFGSTFGRFGAVGAGEDLRTLFVVNAVPIFADHPLLGVGPGRYGGAVADAFGTPIHAAYGTDALLSETQRTVDNFWLHLGIESGLLGTLAFAGAIAVAWYPLLGGAGRAAGWRRVLLSGIAGAVAVLTLDSGTTMLLEANSIGFVYWFLLGLGTGVVGRADSDLHQRQEPAGEPAKDSDRVEHQDRTPLREAASQEAMVDVGGVGVEDRAPASGAASDRPGQVGKRHHQDQQRHR